MFEAIPVAQRGWPAKSGVSNEMSPGDEILLGVISETNVSRNRISTPDPGRQLGFLFWDMICKMMTRDKKKAPLSSLFA